MAVENRKYKLLSYLQIPMYKWRYYQSSRIGLHVPSSDSGWHRFLANIKMADKNVK